MNKIIDTANSAIAIATTYVCVCQRVVTFPPPPPLPPPLCQAAYELYVIIRKK